MPAALRREDGGSPVLRFPTSGRGEQGLPPWSPMSMALRPVPDWVQARLCSAWMAGLQSRGLSAEAGASSLTAQLNGVVH